MGALVEYEWDDKKNAINLTKHKVDFALAEAFDWESSLVVRDSKHSQNEPRFTAIGFIGDRLYVCIYTWRGTVRRIISLRKANNHERKLYNEEV
jgi:hypothetical protein